MTFQDLHEIPSFFKTEEPPEPRELRFTRLAPEHIEPGDLPKMAEDARRKFSTLAANERRRVSKRERQDQKNAWARAQRKKQPARTFKTSEATRAGNRRRLQTWRARRALEQRRACTP